MYSLYISAVHSEYIWRTTGWILGVISGKPESNYCLIPFEKPPLFNRILSQNLPPRITWIKAGVDTL